MDNSILDRRLLTQRLQRSARLLEAVAARSLSLKVEWPDLIVECDDIFARLVDAVNKANMDLREAVDAGLLPSSTRQIDVLTGFTNDLRCASTCSRAVRDAGNRARQAADICDALALAAEQAAVAVEQAAESDAASRRPTQQKRGRRRGRSADPSNVALDSRVKELLDKGVTDKHEIADQLRDATPEEVKRAKGRIRTAESRAKERELKRRRQSQSRTK